MPSTQLEDIFGLGTVLFSEIISHRKSVQKRLMQREEALETATSSFGNCKGQSHLTSYKRLFWDFGHHLAKEKGIRDHLDLATVELPKSPWRNIIFHTHTTVTLECKSGPNYFSVLDFKQAMTNGLRRWGKVYSTESESTKKTVATACRTQMILE